MAIEADLPKSGELAVAADLLQQNRAQLGGWASALPGQGEATASVRIQLADPGTGACDALRSGRGAG